MTKVEIIEAVIEILQKPGTSEAQANLAYNVFLSIMNSRYIITARHCHDCPPFRGDDNQAMAGGTEPIKEVNKQ